MKFVFASDSFKGTLSSSRIIDLLTKAAREVYPEAECTGIPLADGGEGTVEAVVQARNGRLAECAVQDPLGRSITASYGHLSEHEAIMEMASASGLPLLKEEERNPLYASTFGTGQLLGKMMDEGYTDIYIAIGGSATNDGGMGAMRSLGICFYDAQGRELAGTGSDLEKVADIDLSRMTPLISQTEFTVLTDVKNPLCGPDGAVYTFAGQKGADAEMKKRLEKGMCHYRDVLKKMYGIDGDQVEGAGAAGGLGIALKVFLNAHMTSGIEAVLRLIEFDRVIENADLIITGEGRTDWQSFFGKAVQGVGEHAAKFHIPVIDLCGSTGKGWESAYEHGITSVITTSDNAMEMEYIQQHAAELYYNKAVELFAGIKEKGIYSL